MTFKIESGAGKDGSVIRLIGWLRSEYLPQLTAKGESSAGTVVVEMAEVTLVDVEAVRLSTVFVARKFPYTDL